MQIKGEPPQKKIYYKGDVIFNEGDVGNAAYIVNSGAVEIVKKVEGENIRLAVLHEGELFGEMALMDGSPRMASAFALDETVVTRVTSLMFNHKLEHEDKFVQGLFRVMMNNLRNVHKCYTKRARSVEDHIGSLEYHTSKIEKYLDKPDCAQISTEAQSYLNEVHSNLKALKKVFANHKDRRSGVLEEIDFRNEPDC
ncbi:cyclic nucleotide-binding domain-containing protein [Magnetovibrio sp. PR-2]|uniref:cyclic nucleotide-binding domain-containing protein n=1 Tax=Magnetovibrio sp. PR-2 TaxID=3120356 RepID=UPI002FCDF31E